MNIISGGSRFNSHNFCGFYHTNSTIFWRDDSPLLGLLSTHKQSSFYTRRDLNLPQMVVVWRCSEIWGWFQICGVYLQHKHPQSTVFLLGVKQSRMQIHSPSVRYLHNPKFWHALTVTQRRQMKMMMKWVHKYIVDLMMYCTLWWYIMMILHDNVEYDGVLMHTPLICIPYDDVLDVEDMFRLRDLLMMMTMFE